MQEQHQKRRIDDCNSDAAMMQPLSAIYVYTIPSSLSLHDRQIGHQTSIINLYRNRKMQLPVATHSNDYFVSACTHWWFSFMIGEWRLTFF